MAINVLDQLHSSLCRSQLFCNQENFENEKDNLQRIKYITLFEHTQFRATFRTQLDICGRAFLQK